MPYSMYKNGQIVVDSAAIWTIIIDSLLLITGVSYHNLEHRKERIARLVQKDALERSSLSRSLE